VSEHTNPSRSDSDAKFLGWQKTLWEEIFALYNIPAAGHPSFGSPVTGNTLHKLNLQVPGAPLSQRGPYSQQGDSDNGNGRT